MQLPRLYRVTQQLARPQIASVKDAVCGELEKLGIRHNLPKGAKVGVTAGSRGINNIVQILQAAVGYLRNCGFEPFIIAAMGSHGGGNANGQLAVLASLGITPASMGVPIMAGADTVDVGKTASGLSAYINKHAFSADGVIVINRVKLHTGLFGSIQSGLTKGSVVGLGGPAGAAQFHSQGIEELPNTLRHIGSILIEKTPIMAGLAIIENGYDETARIVGVPAKEFLNTEPALLQEASSLMARLPADDLDVLIIEEMGKNYSGTGLDTNIVGRLRVQGFPDPQKPLVRRIVVLDLSEESHGNANGVGCADFVTDKLVAKIDLDATYLNILTTLFLQRGFIPLHFPTEKKTIETAIATLGAIDTNQLRLMIIPNTLHLDELYVSEAFLPELRTRPGIQVAKQSLPFEFDASLNMANRLLSHSAQCASHAL